MSAISYVMRRGDTKSAIARWLKRVRVSLELKQDEFGDKVGLSRGMIGMMEQGKRNITPEFVGRVLDNFDGIMEEPPAMGDIKVIPSTINRGSRVQPTIKFAGIIPASDTWGDPLEATESRDIEAKFAGDDHFLCRVAGDSGWPALLQGDEAVWKTDRNPPYGLIVLAQLLEGHGCTVKQLVWDDKGRRSRLHAINPSTEAPPDLGGWEVVAKLIGVIRRQGTERTWFNPDGLRPEDLK